MDSHGLSGYRFLEPLAAGSFGEVWKVETLWGKPALHLAAVKISYCSSNSREAENELRSLRMAASLEHPGLISIRQIAEVLGRLVVVMDFGVGTLWQLFSHTSRLVGDILQVVGKVAEILDSLASEGIIHGGLTPAEVVICHDQPYLIDFSFMHRIIDPFPNVFRVNLLTWVCASPEMRNRTPTLQSDQFSLAASYVMLRLLKLPSSTPFDQQMDLTQLGKHERQVVGQALSVNPWDRFQSCSKFFIQLETAVRRDGMG